VIHTTAQALDALRVEHKFAAADIKSVRVGTNKRAIALNGDLAPTETMAAQYSMPFTAAVALTRDPRDPRHYSGEGLEDESVRALSQRVELYADPEMEAMYPRYGTRAQVKLNNGRTLETTLLDAHGTPADPCSEDEAKEKFRCLAQAAVSAAAVAEVLAVIDRLDKLPNVSPLSEALRSGAPAATA
jgi:2-methylcitrate dehydratase PrpD